MRSPVPDPNSRTNRVLMTLGLKGDPLDAWKSRRRVMLEGLVTSLVVSIAPWIAYRLG